MDPPTRRSPAMLAIRLPGTASRCLNAASGLIHCWRAATAAKTMPGARELGQANASWGSMDDAEGQPPSPPDTLGGRRILVVEDSPVVAAACEDMLRDLGCVVIGPATTMAMALQLASDEQLDGAIVDVNIRGDKAFPVLRILQDRAIPFLLASGYADWSMPEEWQEHARMAKPYSPTLLRESLLKLLG